MLSFRDWAVRNGKVPVANTTNAAIVASVVE